MELKHEKIDGEEQMDNFKKCLENQKIILYFFILVVIYQSVARCHSNNDINDRIIQLNISKCLLRIKLIKDKWLIILKFRS